MTRSITAAVSLRRRHLFDWGFNSGLLTCHSDARGERRGGWSHRGVGVGELTVAQPKPKGVSVTHTETDELLLLLGTR